MTSPARSPLLPSVFKPDDTADAESSLSPSSPRLKPWQKRRTTSTSSARPRLSPVLKSVEPVPVQRAGAERDDSVRPAPVTRSPKIAVASLASAGPSETRARGQKQPLQYGKDEDEGEEAGGDAEDEGKHKATRKRDDADDNDEDDNEQPEIPYPEVIIEDEDNENADSLTAPPNFRPFFTVLEDSLTGEVYHPATYYIFADDDPTLVTAASMRALGVSSIPTSSPSQSGQHIENQDQAAASAYPDSELLPAPRPGVQERYIVVDVGPDGQSITRAQSLSGGWAVTKSMIVPAPSFGGQDDEEDEGQTMMLKIDGLPMPVSSTSAATTSGKGKKKEARALMEEVRKAHGGEIAKGMEEIVKGIRKSVLELEKIVGEKE